MKNKNVNVGINSWTWRLKINCGISTRSLNKLRDDISNKMVYVDLIYIHSLFANNSKVTEMIKNMGFNPNTCLGPSPNINIMCEYNIDTLVKVFGKGYKITNTKFNEIKRIIERDDIYVDPVCMDYLISKLITYNRIKKINRIKRSIKH